MKMVCDLDVNSDLSNIFVKYIDHEIENLAEKKVKAKRKGKSV